MSIEISKERATGILLWAYENRERCPLNGLDKSKIDSATAIIMGSHKTYRYILITQLLAKAVNKEVDALVLQAGAPFAGAFDSRSLCHNVIVPFERKYLSNGLGGSNEPYLNKPARFTHLSSSNAVRRGADRATLLRLIDLLKNIDQTEAKKLLCYSMNIILQRVAEHINLLSVSRNFSTSLELYHFMRKFLSRSCEGESSLLLVGAMEKMFYANDHDFRVICHPSNEAGASSNEIGDIDIFYKNKYYYSIEVKDKDFSAEDVDFALNKMFLAKAISGGFIYGPHASFDETPVFHCIQRYEEARFIVVFENIFVYLKHMLMIVPQIDLGFFRDLLNQTVMEINAKDATIKWLADVMVE